MAIELKARQIINEFYLVRNGVMSYQDLGYLTHEGCVPCNKIEEFLFCSRVLKESKPKKR